MSERDMSERELHEQIGTLREKLRAIEDARKADENAVLVGRCFRYRNSYSCPESDDDRWWLYSRVTGVDGDGILRAFRFQDDKRGKVEVEYASIFGVATLGEEITLAEFQAALKAQGDALVAMFAEQHASIQP